MNRLVTRFALTTGLALMWGMASPNLSAAAAQQTATFNAPDFDRWNYPFNGSHGTRNTAPVFGALGSEGFDERDGQFLIGFDTAAVLPALGPGQSYQINAVTVTATHSTGSFLYDPTYDSYLTYDFTNDPNATADTDAGRPIILTGAGLRNGYGTAPGTGFTFGTNPPGATFTPPSYQENEDPDPIPGFGTAKGSRSAFAAAFDDQGNLVDVSNNVGSETVDTNTGLPETNDDLNPGFDFKPFAVGTTNLNPGDSVVEAVAGVSPGSTFTFDLDLADAAILGYVQDSINNDGQLFFTLSSLTTTTQANPGNPNFYTRDDFDPAAVPATLTIDFTVVPEPTSLTLLAAGSLLLTGRRRATTRNTVTG